MAKMTTATSEEKNQSVDLSAILARLEASEKLTKELQEKISPTNAFVKSKEIYEGPWHYSYKMWGDIPVISYRSVKGDETKDYTYKNHLGVLINNQFILISRADGKEVKVDALEFGQHFTRSEKIQAQPMKDGQPFTETTTNKGDSYKFTHPTYGEFIVSANCIN